ncbi:acyltransferase family protein [Serratia marcescens]|uniref:Acyltransferase family protein n=1 Tax=Serratia marcescens TaxID=615 RepID=A0ABD5IFB3_SERMA|nr:acyltransferase family protein [Serratia marcescens]MDX7082717.1 acyltransferase family protein [Serratia marcescens]
MSTINNKKEILWINTLKGICILLVVLHHSIITTLIPSIDHLSSGQLPAKLWLTFNKIVSPLRMPAFFFVSGLLAVKAINSKSWSEVFTSKVSNLLYLYILWGLLQWFFIKGFISPIMESQLSDSENSAYAENIKEFSSLLAFAKTSLWYLYALAGYFLVAKLFFHFKYILLAVAVTLNYCAALGIIEGWGIISIAQNMIYFLFGVFFSEELVRATNVTKRNIFIWLAILTLAIININLGIGKNIFTCTLAIIISIIICKTLNNKFNLSWLNWIGKNTLQIYVIHRVVIEIIGVSSLNIGIDNGLFENTKISLLWGVLFPLLDVAVCTSVSILLWKILNNHIGKYLFLHPKLIKSPILK